MSEDYQYTPLENPKTDLRLVQIQYGMPNDTLKCTIRTYNAFHPYQWAYQALSYAWGDSSTKVPISLNSTRFFITSNLEAALRNLRLPLVIPGQKPKMFYWIDAMCIDQSNTDERDEQVRRMKHIYERASHVIVWLGQCHEPRDDMFMVSKENRGPECLKRDDYTSVLQAFSLIDDIAKLYTLPLGDKRIQKQRVVESYAQDTWVQLARVFHRTWFERLWIIQELGAAREAVMICGGHITPWWNVENAAAWTLR
jgi:hypothetical protein